jgi:hypothetical protein
MSNLLEAASELNADRALDIRTAHIERLKKQTKLPTKGLLAYYGTPSGGGPQYDYGGGDQYGYGPGYSYARQAPPCSSRETSRVGAQRGRTAHEK